MLQVKISDKKITPFGGINFLLEELESAGIPRHIDSALPKRHGGAAYKFSDALMGMIYGVFCGADRLEDMGTLKNLMHNSRLNSPSPDQLSKIMRQNLTTGNVTAKAAGSPIFHKINLNPAMNGLLVDVALKLGAIEAGKSHVLDYDNHVIPCEKEDAQFAYTEERG